MSSSENSDHTLASLLPRKIKSLREIYRDKMYDKHFYESVNFGLFSHNDSIYFEEAVKEKKWCKAMDKEIDAIERNETSELIDLSPKRKVRGLYHPLQC